MASPPATHNPALTADPEFQQYLNAIAFAQKLHLHDVTRLKVFLNSHFLPLPPSPRLQQTKEMDMYLQDVLAAIEFFTELSIIIFSQAHGIPPDSESENTFSTTSQKSGQGKVPQPLPRSLFKNSKRRIQRALLSFQLYCELFHQPDDDMPGSVDDWEKRFDEQEDFWIRHEWWEVEEVKCLYLILLFCVENRDQSQSYSTLKEDLMMIDDTAEDQCPASPASSCSSYTIFNDDDENEAITSPPERKSRGLPLLKHFLDGSDTPPSEFEEGYLRRFIKHQFNGFIHIDPFDYGYLSSPHPKYKPYFLHASIQPPNTYRTLACERMLNGTYTVHRKGNEGRHWMCSPYPGVQLEHFDYYPPDELWKIGREGGGVEQVRRERRQVLRMLGWVFWGKGELMGWVRDGKSFGDLLKEADGGCR